MQRLAEDVFRLDLGKANVYVIRGAEGLTLVDAATRGVQAQLEAALRGLGWGLDAVRRIVVTHAHVDHVGGLAELRAASGAAVWAHHLDAPFVRRGEHPPYPAPASLRPLDRWLGRWVERGVGREQPAAPVDRELQDGDWLGEALPGWRLVHLPGHSPGHSGLWHPERHLLLGGDLAMHLTPWLTLPLAAYTSDMDEARASVRRAAALRPLILGVGHGPALPDQAGAALERLAVRRLRPLRGCPA